jgi:hypothetical protein
MEYLKKALEVLRPHAGDFPLSEPNKSAVGRAFALVASAILVLELSNEKVYVSDTPSSTSHDF